MNFVGRDVVVVYTLRQYTSDVVAGKGLGQITVIELKRVGQYAQKTNRTTVQWLRRRLFVVKLTLLIIASLEKSQVLAVSC